MARVTYVKKAQQRYRMVPVIDPETGRQATRTMQRRKPTKAGKTESTVRVTREDREQPLPPYTCDSCGKPIEVGTPYKWIQPKSGPYGGRRRNRHAGCPTWNVWDYSDSLSANVDHIAHDFANALDDVESVDDVQTALDEAADRIGELAEAKSEGASNIEEGFGHETQQSAELQETADSLESWAEDVRSADIPDKPEECEECDGDGKAQCETCDGSGKDSTGEEDCVDCEGEGKVDCEACEGSGEPGSEQMDAWRGEVRDALSVIDECPV